MFLGELLSTLWRAGHNDMEVLHAEVDCAGYDVVLVHRRFVRHVQLKASGASAKTDIQKVHTGLRDTPSGCVVWLKHDAALRIAPPYLWFGGAPGARLPDLGDRVAKQTRANAQGKKAPRESMRIVTAGRFERLGTLDLLIERLFGAPGDATSRRSP